MNKPSNTQCRPTVASFAYRLLKVAVPLILGPGPAGAGPIGQAVVSGQATFTKQGPVSTIYAGNNTIINYQSFDIFPHETVRFIQPDASSRVLNRVIGDGPTSIQGNLLANGHVYIVNPAGIYFGNGSYISVGGLCAAAGSMSDRDFLNQIHHFTSLKGEVSNFGTLHAGSITLAGQHVANHGNITARNGFVALLAGDDVLVGEAGGHVFVNIGKAASPGATGVENSGKILAGGGQSILAAGDLYSLAVMNSGEIHAREITMEGKGSGVVHASGTLDAADHTTGGKGGEVHVLGETVAVTAANIDASGNSGGGTILIGGDYQGHGEARNASQTFVDRDSSLKADATDQGNGGEVVLWSNDSTAFYGSISARGGDRGGDGGFAEISSGLSLTAHGRVDLGAPRGRAGTLLYDPLNIEIRGGTADGDDQESAGPKTNLLQHATSPIGTIKFEDALGDSRRPFVIYESEIEGTDANIILEARNSITTAGKFDGAAVDLRQNRSLEMQTRNNLADSVEAGNPVVSFRQPGINLVGSDDGPNLKFHTSGVDGSITLKASTGGATPQSADVLSGRLETDMEDISISTGMGRITLANSLISGGNVTVSGNTLLCAPITSGAGISLLGSVVLGASTFLETRGGAGTVTVAGSINSDKSGQRSLEIKGAKQTALKDPVGNEAALAGLTTSAAGPTAIGGGVITTTGSQTYRGGVLLGADTTLTSTGAGGDGNVTLSGAVDGAHGLIVNAKGKTTFAGAVGKVTPLTSLVTDDPGTTDLNGATITTIGGQTYNDQVVLSADMSLSSTGNGEILFSKAVDSQTFGSEKRLAVNTGGATRFDGQVGGTVALAGLVTDVGGTLQLSGDITTTSDQVYRDGLIRLGTANTMLENIVTLKSDGAIKFNPDGNAGNSCIATIYKTSPGEIFVNSAAFVMGQNERLYSVGGGGVMIDARTAQLSDIAALGIISVKSPVITLLQRRPANGDTLDPGLEFIGTAIFIAPGEPTFVGDRRADPVANFGTTLGLAKVADGSGIIKWGIDPPPPFVPSFDPRGIPRSPQVGFSVNISEVLGLIAPVAGEEAPPVELSPAFHSYERLFSDLSLAVLDLQNTLGARNEEAAQLLKEMAADIEFFRARHREWAAAKTLREHNPEPCWQCFRDTLDNLHQVQNVDDKTGINVVREDADGFKLKRRAMTSNPNRSRFPHINVKVRTMSDVVEKSGVRVLYKSAGEWKLKGTNSPKWFLRQSSPTEAELCAGNWQFWGNVKGEVGPIMPVTLGDHDKETIELPVPID